MENKKYYELRNYRSIVVRFLGPTNNLGARVQLEEENREGKKIIRRFSYDYECSDIGEQAYKLLVQNGWTVVCKSCLNDRDIILCDNWGTDFKELKDLKEGLKAPLNLIQGKKNMRSLSNKMGCKRRKRSAKRDLKFFKKYLKAKIRIAKKLKRFVVLQAKSLNSFQA